MTEKKVLKHPVVISGIVMIILAVLLAFSFLILSWSPTINFLSGIGMTPKTIGTAQGLIYGVLLFLFVICLWIVIVLTLIRVCLWIYHKYKENEVIGNGKGTEKMRTQI